MNARPQAAEKQWTKLFHPQDALCALWLKHALRRGLARSQSRAGGRVLGAGANGTVRQVSGSEPALNRARAVGDVFSDAFDRATSGKARRQGEYPQCSHLCLMIPGLRRWLSLFSALRGVFVCRCGGGGRQPPQPVTPRTTIHQVGIRANHRKPASAPGSANQPHGRYGSPRTCPPPGSRSDLSSAPCPMRARRR